MEKLSTIIKHTTLYLTQLLLSLYLIILSRSGVIKSNMTLLISITFIILFTALYTTSIIITIKKKNTRQ